MNKQVFFGYCHTGHCWTRKVRLESVDEACDYLLFQRRLWNEVRVTDASDQLIAQAVNGKVVFPVFEL